MTPPVSAVPRIFVSHSHQDNAFCREFVVGLRKVGLEVWYDEHNLGWGELRQVIERELADSQHFIAILSPAAVASQWVNREIDAALALLGEKQLTTFLLVTAAPCTVPLLLRGFKRVEGSGGSAVQVSEAIESTIRILVSPVRIVASPGSEFVMPPDQFPERLANLGFVPRKAMDTQTGKDTAFILPPTVSVPASAFQMGNVNRRDPEGQYDGPARTASTTAFAIARYPATVAEYACFARARDNEPSSWQNQFRMELDHPVVNVSWHDAVAYAEWLARLSGQPWRLPTEEEWEKAARWDSRSGKSLVYPWGDTFDQTHFNTSESGIATTTPVGKYGAPGASPVGAEDMAGNVWEWTSSLYDSYTRHRVLRGGSWNLGRRDARAAYRFRNDPGSFNDSIGFRLVLAAPGS